MFTRDYLRQYMSTNQQIQVPLNFDSMTYIWPQEWNILGKFISLDTEVRIMKIEEESGHVTFISVPGTAFQMYLPRCRKYPLVNWRMGDYHRPLAS